MLILLDQDNVLADFEQGVRDMWRSRHGGEAPVDAARKNFYIRDDTAPEYRNEMVALYSSQGFFASLPPKDGALNAARELLAVGHDVRICTAPINDYRHCVGEKLAWIEKHLGYEWTHRTIIAKDKTWVRGDILIDDKPEIGGSLPALWQHWLYDAPYNRHIRHPHRVDWTKRETWTELLS